jgi:hypothetical protein
MTAGRIYIGQTGSDFIIKDTDISFSVTSLDVEMLRNITLVLKECPLYILSLELRGVTRAVPGSLGCRGVTLVA